MGATVGSTAALVVDAICQFDPHLLATQEGLDHQIAYLQANLPDYHCFGVGREDGAMRGEYAAILYRAERFEQLEGGHFWLSESPDVPGSKSWESSQTRIVTWCRLVERSSPTASFTSSTLTSIVPQRSRSTRKCQVVVTQDPKVEQRRSCHSLR